MTRTYAVYILSNVTGTIYIGVTNNLERRLFEHRFGNGSKFTSKYNIRRLIYFEETDDIGAAILREKELKGWSRKKKEALIATRNPDWNDLLR